MAYVDTSVGSAATALANGHAAPSDEPSDEVPEEPLRIPKERKTAKTPLKALVDQIDDPNLARYYDDQTLDEIGMTVCREYEVDENSRKDWVDKSRKAMRFAMQETQPKQYPWPGASNIIVPMITQASIQFNARTYAAMVVGRSVAKGVVWGPDRGTPVTEDGKPNGKPKMAPPPPQAVQAAAAQGQPPPPPTPVWLIAPGEKRRRAERVGQFMSWQLLEEMPEWEPELDQLLMQIPVVGGAARKPMWDPDEERPRSPFVSLMNLVWNYHAPSFEAAPRVTEKLIYYPNEITTLERAEDEEGLGGAFLEIPYGAGGPSAGEYFGFDEEAQDGDASDEDAPQMFIEQHRRLDLDDDGYAEPYAVTVHLRSQKVVRIVADYEEDGIVATRSGAVIRQIKPKRGYVLYRFLPSIDGGSYPSGWGQLLKPLNEAVNTTLNQMFDAGHLENAGGGFISNKLGMPSGQVNFQVGKYIRVDSSGQSIRDAVLPLPFKGPSSTLFQLLGLLMTLGKELASTQDILAGDASIANAPPTTVLALIEQGVKVYTAIHKRTFRSTKEELDCIFALNRKHLKGSKEYRLGDETFQIEADDFRMAGGVEPIADPKMATDMQKLGRAQIVMAVANDPGSGGVVNKAEAVRRLFEAAGEDQIDDLMVPPDPTAAQMAMAQAQAELGRTRAAEQKDATQAFLNLALARKNSTAGEEAFIDAELSYLRLKIEALNTQVKAAAVDHDFHRTNLEHTRAMAEAAAEQAAAGASGQQPQGDSSAPPAAAPPTPGPTGAFPAAPVAPPGPAVLPPKPTPVAPIPPGGPPPAGPGSEGPVGS